MNELNLETSPYLLQHANNPVNWKGWNQKSLTTAQEKNQLMIISIGYATCHWCHVMEHESFEDEDVAKVMNQHFTAIKVDREERPDVDAVYMKSVQMMTGRGGWPLNIVTLPDGRPVWGGTYFRKDEWMETLNQLQEMYRNNPDKMIDYAEKLHEGIKSISIIDTKDSAIELNQNLLEPLLEKWAKSFDLDYGGMARAPKFMMPNNYQFLLRYGYQKQDKAILDFVFLTLDKMAYGGIFDTVGGGFSRYSVDLKWHVPHFEKMLYDNGQLVTLYAHAFKLTKDPLYQEIIEKTIAFVTRELTNEEGGFYCALDADSINEEHHLEEGAFYVWQKEELALLLKDDFELFSRVFNINSFGYWEHDNYVLIQNQAIEAIAEEQKISVAALQTKKKAWEQLLFDAREKRNKPRLDDKVVTSWNGIMLKGLVEAYKALNKKKYLDLALKNAAFISTKLWKPEGKLMRTYKNGKAEINGYLEDYSAVIAAFLSLYEVTLEESWLQNAKQLTDHCLDFFYNEHSGFFAFTSKEDTPLIVQHFEIEDNVIPASNSVMAENLYALSIYYESSYYEKINTRMLQTMIPSIDYPSAFSNWMNVFLNYSKEHQELAICSKNALDYSNEINSQYHPNVTVAGCSQTSNLPFLKDRFLIDETLFYLCEDKTCQLPSSHFEDLIKKLKTRAI